MKAAAVFFLTGCMTLAGAAQAPAGEERDPEQPAFYNSPWPEWLQEAPIPAHDPDYRELRHHVPDQDWEALRQLLGPSRKEPFEYATIDYPIGEDNPTLYRFDMGPDDSPLLDGYTRVTPQDLFTWERGWGWESAPESAFAYRDLSSVSLGKRLDYELIKVQSLRKAFAEQGKVSQVRPPRRLHHTDPLVQTVLDDLSRDAVLNPRELRFKVALPNGRYQVCLLLGDLQLPRHGVDVYANGSLVAASPYKGELPWPGRISFPVNVVRNNLRIALRSNDDSFSERLATAAATPDYSYSRIAFQAAATRRKSSPFFGKPMNLTGPATQMALAGLTIAPYRRPPLELLRQKVFLSSEVRDENAVQGAESFNRGDLAGARRSFGQIASGEKLLRAMTLLALAGHLETEPEQELGDVEAAMEELQTIQGADPDRPLAEDLLRTLRLYRTGLAYYLSLFKPNVAVSGLPDDGMAPQDSQVLAWVRSRNSVLFSWIQPGDILYAKSLMRLGRYLAAGDPHRWTEQWQVAEEAFIRLQEEAPGNRFSRYFLYWDTEGWGVRDYQSGTEGAPRWAALTREAYNRLLDQAEWWGINRQRADGSLGGGWGDDVEIGIVWQLLALVNPDASPALLETVRALAEGVWWSGEIDRDAGFFDGISDVEHVAEWTTDSQTLMMGIDYGNPIYFERGLQIGKLMRDLWMGTTPRGHLHFRSMVFGNDVVGDSYPGAIDAEIDHPLNGRAVWPAYWAWWYAPLKGLDRLFKAWATAWWEDSMRAENGKPAGIIPGPIGFHTDVLGGNQAMSWRQGAPGANAYENPTYDFYIRFLFSRMFERTEDRKWLEPRAITLSSQTAHLDEQKPVINLAEGRQIKDKYRLLEEFGLESLLAGIRKTWPSVTSEGANTDRIAVPGVAQILGLLTGGEIEGGLGFIPLTLEKTSRDVAFLNLVSSEAFARTIFYNFHQDVQPAHLRLWGLRVGAEHEVKVGVDRNDDDGIDELLTSFTFRLEHRGDSIPVELPPGRAVVVEVRQIRPGQPPPRRAVDLALAATEIEYSEGQLSVTAHNIGNRASGPFRMLVWEGAPETGRLLQSFRLSGLPAPDDLEPSRLTRTLDWTLPDQASLDRPARITVELQPEGNPYEISVSNNRAERLFPHEPESYRIPRLWKSLALQYGFQPGTPVPADFPEERR